MDVFEIYTNEFKSDSASFDLSTMSNSKNDFDRSLVHPLKYELSFVSQDGQKTVKSTVGQMALIAAIVERFPTTGSAIDLLFSKLTEEEISDICLRF